MVVRVREMWQRFIRLRNDTVVLVQEIQLLQVAGRTDAEIAAAPPVVAARGGVVEAFTGLLRAMGESNPALCILLPS